MGIKPSAKVPNPHTVKVMAICWIVEALLVVLVLLARFALHWI